jgi:hypothetical protein
MLDTLGGAVEFLFGTPWLILLIGLFFGVIYAILQGLSRRNLALRPWPMLVNALGWLAWAAYEGLGGSGNFSRADDVVIFVGLLFWTVVSALLSRRWGPA